MHKKLLVGIGAAALVVALGMPAVSQAKSKRLPMLPAPTAVDSKGDASAIGRYNSEQKNSKRKVVSGTVTAVSATSITVQVGIKSSDDSNKNTNTTSNTNATVTPKTYTFIINDATKIIRKHKAMATINEVAVGDMVQVWSTKLASGVATLIWDKSIWYAEVHGVVSNLNTTTGMFTFTVTKDKVEYSTTVKYDTMTKFLKKDGTVVTSASLANGQSLKVQGAWDSVGKFLLAKRIVIKS